MKKIVLMTMLLFAVSTGSALAAFTEGANDGSLVLPIDATAGAADTAVVKLSKNVKLDYIAETDGLGYIVGSTHTSGTKTYGSSSGDSKIWSIDGVETALPTTAPAGTASADFSGDWIAL